LSFVQKPTKALRRNIVHRTAQKLGARVLPEANVRRILQGR